MGPFRPYELQSVNGLAGDPAVHIFIKRTGESLLFDLGDIGSLSHRELLKVRHVFVSHTHVDHFIGFDRLLRVNIPHRRSIHVYGPKGLAANIRHKILAYTWNLIDDDQINFVVSEIDASQKTLSRFTINKATDFELLPQGVDLCQDHFPLAILADRSQVTAVPLDHKGISSIAYQLCAPIHSKINSQRLDQLGLNPGPWVSDLQAKVANDELTGHMQVDGLSLPVIVLAKELVVKGEAFRFTYLTDISYDRNNLRSLKSAFSKTSCLLSECSFLDEDWQRAKEKAHLTTRQAALIACYLEAESLEVFHISNIYSQRLAEVVDEAQGFFQRFRCLPANLLQEEINREMMRCEN
ncbi:MAG: hypothetical protein ACOH5I_14635 [Oligoflexus sp.]